ncbi:MAG: glycosyl hydrolase family 57, partial [Planctomycetota bacterium]
MVFGEIYKVEVPEKVFVGEGFTVFVFADGEIPFPQIILSQDDGHDWIIKDILVAIEEPGVYRFSVPADSYKHGKINLKIEGCKKYDISIAGADDWVTVYHETEAVIKPAEEEDDGSDETPEVVIEEEELVDGIEHAPLPEITIGDSNEPVIYFGIHKHMHQPFYNAVDASYWDGEKDEIFGTRGGAYTHYIPTAVWQYINGALSHAGLSTSWSGSLIEQLNRAGNEGLCGGCFSDWNKALREMTGQKTAFGNPRVEFTAFGYFHPLMPLIPDRDIIGQIEWHRNIIKESFGAEAGNILFPPETAFHPHMIPALNKAGIEAVIYDSIHHFRACKDYPYAGVEEGMLPPNEAEQENFPVNDWLQLNNIWAPSKISPTLLKPCILCYTDHTGERHKITGIPAERYLGNE